MGNVLGAKRFWGAVVVIVVVGLCASTFMFTMGRSRPDPRYSVGIDDAYISYRYARNFARGEGLVFNQGERVEGYSNFLWVLLLALPDRLGLLHDPHSVAFLLNAGAYVVMLLTCALWFEQLFGARRALFGLALVAFFPNLWVWVAAGLESVSVACLQILLLLSVTADVKPFSGGGLRMVLCLLLVLFRIDGFIVPVFVSAYLFLTGREHWKHCLGTTILAFGGLTAWRVCYYGQLMPNTVHAKVAGPLVSRLMFGFRHARAIALDAAYLFLFVVSLLAVGEWILSCVENRRIRLSRVPAIVLFFPCFLLYFLVVGGDCLWERMFLFVIPGGIFALLHFARGNRRLLLALSLFFVAHVFLVTSQDLRYRPLRRRYDPWIALGKTLSKFDEIRLIAVDAAGKIPYSSGIRCLDMLGLCDPTIARLSPEGINPGHLKFSPDYVLGRRPDLICAMFHLDLGSPFGLTRSKLAGSYRPSLLLQLGMRSGPSVIDVSKASDDELRQLFLKGYQYVVYRRRDLDFPWHLPGYEEVL